MRYRFVIAILALLLCQQAFTQVSPHPFRGSITTSGADCSTATSCVVVTLPNDTASATIALDADTGSFSGTVQFEGSVDGTTWIAMKPTPNSTDTNSSATATGSWQFNPSSYIKIRVRASARASGTAGVIINWGPAAASSFTGGNGSGSVTSVATTSPITGGAITTSGTIACAACVVSTGSVNVTKTTPCTLGTAATNCGANNFLSGYTYNQHATAATAITYTLPTAAAGLQHCVGNSYSGTAADTGVLTINTSAAGQFIIDVDGTLGSTGGHVTSGGAGGDAMCFRGVDATHWQLYCNHGTCTKS